MSLMLPITPYCVEHVCAWKALGLSLLREREIADTENHNFERRHTDELAAECMRLMEEQSKVTVQP